MRKEEEAFIRENQMIDKGDRVIAAVSGGADSVCMLHLLVALKKILEFDIFAVHVHHGLRGQEADRDEEYVRGLSAMWEVPCLVVHTDAAAYARKWGMGVEEAGRELRYQIFDQEAERTGARRIAVAHNMEDQAETILHNLFRGSGIKGLGGMEPVRGKIIRPLLWASRRQILDYLEERGISYCTDSTNASMEYTRNKLRSMVIPMVCREINPGAVAHIAETGKRLLEAERYFDQEADRLWRDNRIEGSFKGQRGIRAEALAGFPDILKGYVVMKIMGELTGARKDITSAHVAGILDLAQKGTGRSVDLPRGLRARREYDVVWIEQAEEEEALEEKRAWEDLFSCPLFTAECFPSEILREKHQKIPENKYTKWFDYDKIKGTVSVRTRRPGDYFVLKDGKKKTVKAFMIDEKIPRTQRDRILLVTEGKHVLWIVGRRISEFYKVTDATRQILQVSMDGGKEHDR